MPLRDATLEAVQQIKQVITICERIYGKPSELAMSPIGRHIRHVIDHLWAFQEGLKTGCIDYNSRHRDTILEDDPVMALKAIENFEAWLANTQMDNKQLTVISEISVNQCQSTLMKSNVNRELAFLIQHAFHHVAFTKLLAKTHGLELPEHLGVAPATATYLRGQQVSECAP